jgi:hypothetical protein
VALAIGGVSVAIAASTAVRARVLVAVTLSVAVAVMAADAGRDAPPVEASVAVEASTAAPFFVSPPTSKIEASNTLSSKVAMLVLLALAPMTTKDCRTAPVFAVRRAVAATEPEPLSAAVRV